MFFRLGYLSLLACNRLFFTGANKRIAEDLYFQERLVILSTLMAFVGHLVGLLVFLRWLLLG
jgi:hypothetical protein